jgi:hypothetical protein
MDVLERILDPKGDWIMSPKAKQLMSDAGMEISRLREENKKLREAFAIAATWTADPGVTIKQIQSALWKGKK